MTLPLRIDGGLRTAILLSSAASLATVAVAHAADLPLKANPVQYVKICSLYGEGYYYIPGSDTCIKVGGVIRVDYGYNVTGARTPFYAGAAGAQDRTISPFSTRHRANLSIESRTGTSYGTLRTLTTLLFQNENQSESFNVRRALIQWAGFTFGRAQSSVDTWTIDDTWHLSVQQNNSETVLLGINTIAYTWELGGGFTFTVGADERRTKPIANLSSAAALKIGAAPTNAFTGERWPDVHFDLKYAGNWGFLAATVVAHDVSATY